MVEFLAGLALPEDADAVVRHHIWEICIDLKLGYGSWGSVRTLRRLFEVGVRWEESSKEAIANVRRLVLGASNDTFVDLMKVLARDDYCSPEILHELARTPAMRRRMKEVGFMPPDPDDSNRHRWHQYRPTRFREVLKKSGIELPKPPPRPLPREFWIGSRRRGKREIRMDREELFERVWSTPAYKLAEEWGLSGTGLRKACKRLKIPTPGRGYWQKAKAGKRVHRPKLPELPEGEAEEIVIWTPE